jgi:hypothetical protein
VLATPESHAGRLAVLKQRGDEPSWSSFGSETDGDFDAIGMSLQFRPSVIPIWTKLSLKPQACAQSGPFNRQGFRTRPPKNQAILDHTS